jgi:hypothetical protein
MIFFVLNQGQACLEKWEMIPDDTDILVTHTPPVGFGDLCCSGVRAGERIRRCATNLSSNVLPW